MGRASTRDARDAARGRVAVALRLESPDRYERCRVRAAAVARDDGAPRGAPRTRPPTPTGVSRDASARARPPRLGRLADGRARPRRRVSPARTRCFAVLARTRGWARSARSGVRPLAIGASLLEESLLLAFAGGLLGFLAATAVGEVPLRFPAGALYLDVGYGVGSPPPRTPWRPGSWVASSPPSALSVPSPMPSEKGLIRPSSCPSPRLALARRQGRRSARTGGSATTSSASPRRRSRSRPTPSEAFRRAGEGGRASGRRRRRGRCGHAPAPRRLLDDRRLGSPTAARRRWRGAHALGLMLQDGRGPRREHDQVRVRGPEGRTVQVDKIPSSGNSTSSPCGGSSVGRRGRRARRRRLVPARASDLDWEITWPQ